ncbi:MAG: threonine-phosphate decarboxylase [Chromatiaceae bacterium]|nr:MAG: threonine-phosphate decarboxylase [Chromatiaceae bacterium]
MNPPAYQPAALAHGGRLRAAARRYAIPLADWLDLSTGINPNGWPVPPVPAAAWQRLPEDEDELVGAAAGYYGSADLLPVAGSQAAILHLPRLRPPGRVGVLAPGYGEYAPAFAGAGHRVEPLAAAAIATALERLDVLVLAQPNNPDGCRFAPAQLLDWQARLATRGGWLIVDEAFADATPETSLAAAGPRPGLILLRSLGKFFGLAGARVGFVLARAEVTGPLAALLGPWTVAGPARWVATRALADRPWQQRTRVALPRAGARLARLLTDHGLAPAGGCALFQWIPTTRAADLHQTLAAAGILTRYFADPPALRLGLPGSEADWQRLAAALGRVR